MILSSKRIKALIPPSVVIGAYLTAAQQVATAASFDCHKAQTKMEQAICADPQLSALDDRLGSTYKAARGALSPEAAKVLSAGQASWLKFFSQSCFVDSEAAPVAAGETSSCLKEAYEARIARLEETGKVVGGFKSYWAVDNAFKAFPESHKIGSAEQEYMQLDDSSPLAASINNALRAEVTQKAAITDDEEGTQVSRWVSLKDVSPDVLEISTSLEADMGGSHPDGGVSYRYFSKSLNRMLAFGDLFVSDTWKPVAALISQEALAKEQLEPISEPATAFAEVKPSDLFGYCIDGKKGFTVDRAFLSYADRAQDTVDLPWSAFSGMLTDYAKGQIAMFPATRF
jgi:uncharacterized protein